MIRLERDGIDPGGLLNGFNAGRSTSGAVVSFTGLVRGGGVQTLTLEAHPRFTLRVLENLETEVRARFAVDDVLVAHRFGALTVGEPVVFVAVAAPHRRSAFQAADWLMDQLKTRAPFWKREDGPGGRRWVEPRDQDRADAARWTA